MGCPFIGKVIKMGATLLPPGIPIPAAEGAPVVPDTELLVFIRKAVGPAERGCEVFMEVTLLDVGIPPSVLGVVVEADFSERLEP